MNGSAAPTPTLPLATRLQLGLFCLGRHATESCPQSRPGLVSGVTSGREEGEQFRFEEEWKRWENQIGNHVNVLSWSKALPFVEKPFFCTAYKVLIHCTRSRHSYWLGKSRHVLLLYIFVVYLLRSDYSYIPTCLPSFFRPVSLEMVFTLCLDNVECDGDNSSLVLQALSQSKH